MVEILLREILVSVLLIVRQLHLLKKAFLTRGHQIQNRYSNLPDPSVKAGSSNGPGTLAQVDADGS
jgi:hypothetical protein